MKDMTIAFRCGVLLLVLSFTLGLKSQHIYVRSTTPAAGGWIVSGEGETHSEIPAGWYLAGNPGTIQPLGDWPVLCERFPRQDSLNFAFLHEDGRWEVLTKYNRARAVGASCYNLGQKGNKSTILWCPDQQVELENTFIRTRFNEKGLAVGRFYYNGTQYLDGVLNKEGRWVFPPCASALTDMGQNRFLYRDTLKQEYLLKIEEQDLGVAVDTIFNLQERGWELRTNWPFDETGHSWVIVGHRQLVIIDKEGTVKSDTVRLSYSRIRPFKNGLSEIGHPPRWVDTNGEAVYGGSWRSILTPSDDRILVLDTITKWLGYMDLEEQWVIEPAYCYATSFRDGLAVTSHTRPEQCVSRVRYRKASGANPALLTKKGSRGYFEVIDVQGEVVLQDSCYDLYLLPNQVVGRTQGPSLIVPAFRIDWLASGQYWLSPDYHFSDWPTLLQAPIEDVERIDLGIKRYHIGLSGRRYSLPDNFAERVRGWSKLRKLALDYHLVADAFPVITTLENLEKLSLARCSLTEIPSSIRRLDQLTYLDISSNDLEELPNGIYQMQHLVELNVADNPLPPETIVRLRKRLPTTKIIYKREW